MRERAEADKPGVNTDCSIWINEKTTRRANRYSRNSCQRQASVVTLLVLRYETTQEKEPRRPQRQEVVKSGIYTFYEH